MLIHNKDDIEFVTEFPCFLVHPVAIIEALIQKEYDIKSKLNVLFKDVSRIKSRREGQNLNCKFKTFGFLDIRN